jgi:deoxyribonuclease-4
VWKPGVHSDEDLARFRELAANADLVAMCHAPYLINLAGTDPLTVERSEAVLAQALRTTRGLGALAVIVHLGSHLGSGFDAGLERAAPVLERVLELAGDGTWLLLEDTAGAGGTMGLTIEELAIVIERCGSHPWLGVCLDSCHLYASGIDVGDPAAVDAMLDELDERIGLDRPRCTSTTRRHHQPRPSREPGDGLIGERLAPWPPAPAGARLRCWRPGATARRRTARTWRARAPWRLGVGG